MDALKGLTDMKFFVDIMSKNDEEFDNFLVGLVLYWNEGRMGGGGVKAQMYALPSFVL